MKPPHVREWVKDWVEKSLAYLLDNHQVLCEPIEETQFKTKTNYLLKSRFGTISTTKTNFGEDHLNPNDKIHVVNESIDYSFDGSKGQIKNRRQESKRNV